MVKTDADGNMQWKNNYGGNGTETVESLIQTSDGGYALAGYTDSFGAAGDDFWLVKTDENGIASIESGQVPFPTEIIYAVTTAIIMSIIQLP